MILITRPIKQAIATQQELEFRGYNSVVYPLLEIHPENFEVDFSKYDAAIITSQNAAEIVRAKLNNIPLFLVGAESAAILYDKNIQCVAQDAKELLAKIKTYPYKNYLYLSGDHISTKINADRKIVYRSVAVTKLPKEILEYVTSVLFYSARTAETFAKLIGNYNLSKCEALCISQKTADQIKHLAWQSILVAKNPNENTLFSLLDKT
jgi:uroporphyrinogen-III synthase